MNSLKAVIDTQCDIANVLHHCDYSDKDAQEAYLKTYEVYDKAHAKFWDFINDAKQNSTCLLSILTDFEKRNILEKE